MSDALIWAIAGLGLATFAGTVVLYIRRAAFTEVALVQSAAALAAEVERRDALEKAAAAEATARAKEFDAAKAAVRTAHDAADLLRDALSRSNTN